MRGVGLTLALGLLAAPLPRAQAQTPPEAVRLDYQRDDRAGCPPRAEITARVRARLGYDPFDEQSLVVLRVRTRGDEDATSAHVEVQRPEAPLGVRELQGAGPGCDQLAESLVLALTIVIDPTALTRAPPEPDGGAPEPRDPESTSTEAAAPATTNRAVAPPSSSAPPSEPDPADEEPRDLPFELGLSAGGLGAIEIAPLVTFGFTLGVELRWPYFSVGLGARADIPVRTDAAGGEIETNVAWGELVVCGRYEPGFLCVVGAAGAFRGEGRQFLESRSSTVPQGALGGRVGVDISIVDGIGVRLQLDVLAALTRTAVLVGGAEVWNMPALSGALAALFTFHFS